MIHLYDNAIVKDLENSFNRDVVGEPVVRVVGPDAILGLAAQIQNDEIKFPIVALTREQSIAVDGNLTNFTRSHKGVPAFFDNETNQVFYERSMPINLSYKLTVLTTNQADMDEMMRELLFKYTSMYFLTIRLPYEGRRKLNFGIAIDNRTEIEQSSGAVEYLTAGTLYQSIVPLYCQGCMEITYTPRHLTRLEHQVKIKNPSPNHDVSEHK